MKVAVVSPHHGDLTREEDLVVRRVAGSLAISNSVDLLHPHTGAAISGPDGAVNIISFNESEAVRARYRPFLEASFGAYLNSDESCDCVSEAVREVAKSIPRFVQDELLRSTAGNSPPLFNHLREVNYDLVVFAGYEFASTRFGMDHVPVSTKTILLPLAKDEPAFWMPAYDSVFAKPDQILVTTHTEELLIWKRIGKSARDRVVNIRFALKVNRLSEDTIPIGLPTEPFILAGGETLSPRELKWLRSFAALLSVSMPDIRLVVVGPRTRPVDETDWYGRPHIVSRTDLWRWMTRALAFLDPRPKRILGREVLEAYLLGTPVLVSRDGGANLEHADEGNGGLWFSGFNELEAGLNLLADDDLRGTLGQQGREYALREYGDSAKFIQRVNEAVLDKET